MADVSSTLIVDIIINLIITLVFYGAGPMLLAKKRKGLISKGRLKLFSITYTFLVWFLIFCLFNVLVLGGQVSSGASAVLWGVVFYRRAKATLEKRCLLRNSQSEVQVGMMVKEQVDAKKQSAIPVEHYPIQEADTSKFVIDAPTGEAVSEVAKETFPVAEGKQSEQKRTYRPLNSLDNHPQHCVPIITRQIKYCRKCGFELISGSSFCSRCGVKVIEDVKL